MIETVSDILLIAGSFGLAAYCWVLSRRLRRLAKTDEGMGASIAALAGKVDSLHETVRVATSEADSAAERLGKLIEEADRHEGELSVLMAGLSDVEDLSGALAEAAKGDGPEADDDSDADTADEIVFVTKRRAAGGAS